MIERALQQKMSRRDLLKRAMPLGWVGEVIEQGGCLSEISPAAQFSLFKDAAFFLSPLVACTPNQTRPPVQPSVVIPSREQEQQELLGTIQSEVRRLVLAQPEESLVKKVYTGDLIAISPIFTPRLQIKLVSNPNNYAENTVRDFSLTPDARFSVVASDGVQKEDYHSLLKIKDISVGLSKNWLSSTDTAKLLALEKEAANLTMYEKVMPELARQYAVALNNTIRPTNSSVTREEIGRTLGVYLTNSNPDMKNLKDWAGYLYIMPKVGRVRRSTDAKSIEDMRVRNNIMTVYDAGIKAGLNFPEEGFILGSDAFLFMAFDIESRWVKFVQSLPPLDAPNAIR